MVKWIENFTLDAVFCKVMRPICIGLEHDNRAVRESFKKWLGGCCLAFENLMSFAYRCALAYH